MKGVDFGGKSLALRGGGIPLIAKDAMNGAPG